MIKDNFRLEELIKFCDNSNMAYKGEAIPRFINEHDGFHLTNKETAMLASNIRDSIDIALGLPKRSPRRQYNSNRGRGHPQRGNPKEYWSLVNQLRNEQTDKSVSDIDGDTWYNYFSNLGLVPNNLKSRLHEIENKLKLLEEGNISFLPLDFKITKAELRKAYSKLNSGKSPGQDNVSNKMLKVSQSYIGTCLLKEG
ncbi:unnamed protein product [Mytilus coruscus]|uniref:Uncharacterized protein n=1 Tax=Mytilus coruscus TaxID=42192 RepID=A0A6J8EW01_MYTCO|nr:unnamed protein product [Mytilus coruscus]